MPRKKKKKKKRRRRRRSAIRHTLCDVRRVYSNSETSTSKR
jgi:hypothetical protein